MDLLDFLRQQEKSGFRDSVPTPPDAESSDSDHMAFVQVGDGPDGVAVAEFDSESTRRAPRNSASTSIVQKHRVFFSGPPPALPGDTGGKDCVVVVSGIEWWVDDTAIRKGALQYGQVRAVRILTEERTGMSTG
ncbi:MAG: hypothetical protein KVP17_001573 [Porospora cf. gigantea B]|uniref:uncharacterized protein n=1 Tax=Porospora cf. gigantea B TaxID=2853592 RepID=UPI003571E606|nr:MAG: hypothetical protein KVP17_001573 [Porospora cf. gigantea B]